MSNDGRRFCKLYAIALVVIACLLGALQTLQAGVGLSQFGGLEYTWRMVLLSALRSNGPAATGSALTLALLLWSAPISQGALALELTSKLKLGLWLSLVGYPVASLLSIAASVPLAAAVFGLPFGLLRAAFAVVTIGDVAAGALSTLADALVISLVAWRALPRLRTSKLSLPAQIAVALPVLFVIRALVGLALPTFEN